MMERLKAASASMNQRLLERAREPIRERAIKQVKAKLARQQRRVEDLTEDEREDLVAAEEKSIKAGLMLLPFGALLVLLGLR